MKKKNQSIEIDPEMTYLIEIVGTLNNYYNYILYVPKGEREPKII